MKKFPRTTKLDEAAGRVLVGCQKNVFHPIISNLNDCSDEGLTFETSAKHHIPQATNIPYQPLLIKPVFSVLAHAEKQFFQN